MDVRIKAVGRYYQKRGAEPTQFQPEVPRMSLCCPDLRILIHSSIDENRSTVCVFVYVCGLT